MKPNYELKMEPGYYDKLIEAGRYNYQDIMDELLGNLNGLQMVVLLDALETLQCQCLYLVKEIAYQYEDKASEIFE